MSEEQKRAKIEINLLSPATREEALQLFAELKKIKGFEDIKASFSTSPAKPGEMSLEMLLLDGFIHGFLSGTLEHPLKAIPTALHKFVTNHGKTKNAGENKEQEGELSFIHEENGTRTGYYINSNGVRRRFISSDYIINPKRTHAILIGISHYEEKNTFFEIPPVEGNLTELAKVLTNSAIVGLPTENIHVLYNQNSSKIRNELRKISQRQDMDTLLIYYAGHGTNGPDKEYYLTANDSYFDDTSPENHIPYSLIDEIQQNSPALQKLVFIDACLSGLAAKKAHVTRFETNKVSGIFLFASTAFNKSSHFKEDAQFTYFTAELIKAFKEGAATSAERVSLLDICNYTKQRLDAAKHPSPVFVSKLNILPESYFVGFNPAFSQADQLEVPERLFKQGKYKQSMELFHKLIHKYPHDIDLKNRFFEYDKLIKNKSLIEQANKLFYVEQNYEDALDKYRQAHESCINELLLDKIRECEEMTSGTNTAFVKQETAIPDKDKKSHLGRWGAAVFSCIIIAIATKVVMHLIEGNAHEKEIRQGVPANHKNVRDTVTVRQALADTTHPETVRKKVFYAADTIPARSRKEILTKDIEQFKDSCRTKNFDYAAALIDRVKIAADADVWYYIAMMYQTGKGIGTPNERFAIQWYKKAAGRFQLAAMDSLGSIYLEKDDIKNAIYWYRKSAKLNSVIGEEQMGRFYETGRGLPGKKPEYAIYWFRQAAANGSKAAIAGLRRLHYPLDEYEK